MCRHRDSWRLWLETLAPISTEIIPAMAEALSMAAPHGPLGFRCVDSNCDGSGCIQPMLVTRVKQLEEALDELLRTQDPNEWLPPERRAAIEFARAVIYSR